MVDLVTMTANTANDLALVCAIPIMHGLPPTHAPGVYLLHDIRAICSEMPRVGFAGKYM